MIVISLWSLQCRFFESICLYRHRDLPNTRHQPGPIGTNFSLVNCHPRIRPAHDRADRAASGAASSIEVAEAFKELMQATFLLSKESPGHWGTWGVPGTMVVPSGGHCRSRTEHHQPCCCSWKTTHYNSGHFPYF